MRCAASAGECDDMAFEEAFVGLLRGASAVTVIVGSGSDARIYPNRPPQGVASPFVTYERISTVPIEPTLNEGLPFLYETLVQVDCWAERLTSASGYQQVRDLAAAVRTALSETGTISAGVEMRRISYTDERDLFEEGWQRRQLEFTVYHTEV